LDIRAAVSQQALAQTRQCVRRRRHGLGGAEAPLQPPKAGPQGPLGVVQRARGEAEGDRDTRRPGAPPPRPHRAPRHLGLGTPPQPTPAVVHARPPVPSRAALPAEEPRRVFFDPRDGGPVDAGQAREWRAGIEPGCVGLLGAAGLGREGRARPWIVQGCQRGCALLSAWGARLGREGIQLDRWASGQQGCGAPGALQRRGAVVRGVVAGRVAPLGQARWGTRTREDGLEDGPAGHAGDRTDDLGERAMHLFEGLVPLRHRVGGIGQQPLPMTHVPAEHAPLMGRADGPGEQPVCVQAWEPRTVEPSSLRAARDTLGLTRIAPQALHAARCQERKEGHPGDAGRCPRDGGHATRQEPVGSGVKGGGARPETAHGLRVAPWGHGDPVLGCAEVDARGVGVADLEGFGEQG
jgi:hypothetical protein